MSTQFQPNWFFFPVGSNVPSIQSNPTIATYTDPRPTQAISGPLTIPAGVGVAPLPVPTTWTQVTTMGIINMDPLTNAVVILANNDSSRIFQELMPAYATPTGGFTPGGQVWLTGASPATVGETHEYINLAATLVATAAIASPPALQLYFYLAGY